MALRCVTCVAMARSTATLVARLPPCPASAYPLLTREMPDSFDGRYFGPVTHGRILGKAHPLWLL